MDKNIKTLVYFKWVPQIFDTGVMFLISNPFIGKIQNLSFVYEIDKVFLINTLFIGKEQNISNCDVNKTICFCSHATIHEKGK